MLPSRGLLFRGSSYACDLMRVQLSAGLCDPRVVAIQDGVDVALELACGNQTDPSSWAGPSMGHSQ